MNAEAMCGTVSRWVSMHEELVELARRRSELDGLEGCVLLRAFRAGVHRHLGFASFAEYVERLFGYSRRTLDDKLRTAEALEVLPELALALRDGSVSWSAARELVRVATAETEHEWLAVARGKSVHQIERLVAGRNRGGRPGEAPNPAAQRHVLRFEVSAETFATFRDAVRVLRQKSNQPLDDDSALLLMAREVLGGPADAGRASYQIAVDVCERCRGASQHANGEGVRVDSAIVEMAECDAQHIGHVASEPPHVGERARATQTIPPALRRKVMRRDHGRCVVPGCRHATFVDVHHIEARADGGTHDESNMVVLCSAHHRAVPRGQLRISGDVGALVFRRADGAHYGTMSSVRHADTHHRAFRALRALGFAEKDARRALERVRSANAPTESLLRQSLALLTERAMHH
jgi:hypothetical protein